MGSRGRQDRRHYQYSFKLRVRENLCNPFVRSDSDDGSAAAEGILLQRKRKNRESLKNY
jgi:hypothetical protein